MSEAPSTIHAPTAGSEEPPTSDQVENVSLGPACGVIAVLVLVATSFFFIIGYFVMLSRQPQYAVASIQRQLIPWVEESELSNTDKDRVVGRLNELITQIERQELTSRQLQRLAARLSQNPVLQWAPIEQAIALAQTSPDFTDAEREQLQSLSDRLLEAAGRGRISMDELQFVLQPISLRNSKTGRLILKEDVGHNQVMEMVQRGEQLLRSIGLQDVKTTDSSVGQMFERMVEEAMDESRPLVVSD